MNKKAIIKSTLKPNPKLTIKELGISEKAINEFRYSESFSSYKMYESCECFNTVKL